MRSYRDKETGKVKQEATYIGKEVEKDGEKMLIPPVDCRTVRRVLDSAGYIMYHQALDNGFLANYEDALLGITNIREAANKILMLAAETITGLDHSIHLHADMPELKEIRDVVELVGMKDPDVASILERSMAGKNKIINNKSKSFSDIIKADKKNYYRNMLLVEKRTNILLSSMDNKEADLK
ncbi:MAG: hypothetical protein ACP5MB_06880 [bacterium]